MEDQLYYYEMRMTPYPNNEYMTKFYREKIKHFVADIGGIDYLFGQEYDKNFHFHIVFSHTASFANKKKCPKAEEIRHLFYTYFEVLKDKKGNPSHELCPIRNLEKALSYAVKDGNYEASAEWIQIAEDAFEKSYEKKHSMRRSLAMLATQYDEGVINDKQLWIGLGQTRADLGLPLSVKWLNDMLLSYQVKKNPSILNDLWESQITSRNK